MSVYEILNGTLWENNGRNLYKLTYILWNKFTFDVFGSLLTSVSPFTLTSVTIKSLPVNLCWPSIPNFSVRPLHLFWMDGLTPKSDSSIVIHPIPTISLFSKGGRFHLSFFWTSSIGSKTFLFVLERTVMNRYWVDVYSIHKIKGHVRTLIVFFTRVQWMCKSRGPILFLFWRDFPIWELRLPWRSLFQSVLYSSIRFKYYLCSYIKWCLSCTVFSS